MARSSMDIYESRMVTANLGSISSAGYVYDGEGQRVQKIICPAGTSSCTPSVSGATSTTYVYDASGNLAAEYTSSTPPPSACGTPNQPNSFTGGEGSATGEEVLITVDFATPILLPADFFRPEALLSVGDFLWLSAPKPIVAPGTPFAPDLQSWIRNDDMAPDWLRIGTDITHQGPFNAAFTLTGETVPEPSTWTLLAGALGFLALGRKKLINR